MAGAISELGSSAPRTCSAISTVPHIMLTGWLWRAPAGGGAEEGQRRLLCSACVGSGCVSERMDDEKKKKKKSAPPLVLLAQMHF